MRNQGFSTSCWAFSAINLLEVALQMQGKFVDWLSIDQVVKCVEHDAEGGNPMDAIQFLQQYEPQLDRDIRAGVAINCKKPFVRDYQGHGGFQLVTALLPCATEGEDCRRASLVEETMIRQLDSAPFLTWLDASQWANYHGVLNGENYDAVAYDATKCSMNPKDGNHLVIITNVVTDKKSGKRYWLVLNSWSQQWGVEGFIYLPYGVNACGLANAPVSFTINGGEVPYDVRRATLSQSSSHMRALTD
jgi:hypothetical protein